MAAAKKMRLDQRVCEQYPEYSRAQVQSWIMQGKVRVDDQVVTKAGTPVGLDAVVVLSVVPEKYVCRAGWKLEKALDHFSIDVTDAMVLDAGLSTGGFTDCLLQRGVRKVFGVDVGYGQVHENIRMHERVVVMEKTNLRHLERLPFKVNLITLDLSFISVLKVMEAVCRVATDDARLVVLIKPQFEARREQIGRGGIVKDPAVHREVIERVTQGIEQYGFACQGVTESPITGATGNIEFLGYFIRKVAVPDAASAQDPADDLPSA